MKLVIEETINGVTVATEKETTLVIADFDTGAGAVPLATVTAKGALIAGTANATVNQLVVGSNGQVLTAESSEATGLKWVATSGLLSAQKDGWVPVYDTWTYASATTINVPAGAVSLYPYMMKLQFDQHGVTKHFNAVTIADTLLTVRAGNDFAVENTATYPITNIKFSTAEIPLFFPTWFDLTGPTWTTTGTAFTNQPTNIYQKYRIVGHTLHIKGYAQCHATSGGTGIFIATFTANEFPTILSNASGTVLNTLDHWSGSTLMETGTPLQVKMHKYDGNAIGGNYATMLYDITAII